MPAAATAPRRMRRWLARRRREGWSWTRLSQQSAHPVWRLRYWQRRLEQLGATAGRRGPSFAAIEVNEPVRHGGPIAITTPTGYRLEVAGDATVEQLRRVVEALARQG